MSVLSFPSRSLPRQSQMASHGSYYAIPEYYYECAAFLYASSYYWQWYVMDDFGDAVISLLDWVEESGEAH